MGAQAVGFTALQHFRVYPWQAYFLPVMIHDPCQECTEWLLLPLLQVGGASFSCSPTIPTICWGIQLLCHGRESPDTLPFLYGREGSPFPGSVLPDDPVNSKCEVGVTPGDSGVLIRL